MTIRKIHWSSPVCIENSNACCSVAELKTKQNTKTQMMMMMKLMSDPIKSWNKPGCLRGESSNQSNFNCDGSDDNNDNYDNDDGNDNNDSDDNNNDNGEPSIQSNFNCDGSGGNKMIIMIMMLIIMIMGSHQFNQTLIAMTIKLTRMTKTMTLVMTLILVMMTIMPTEKMVIPLICRGSHGNTRVNFFLPV